MASSTTSKPLHITSLGSSFAAGPGIPPITNKSAGRSGHNYAAILSSRLNAKHSDLTISGATLLSVIQDPQTVWRGPTFPPQIRGLSPDADIVTLTAGGNDLNYASDVMRDTVNKYAIGRAAQWMFPAQPVDPPKSVEDLAARFAWAVEKIHDVAPKARIYLVEYLALFGDDTDPEIDVPLDEEQVKHHREVAERLSQAYRLGGKMAQEKGINVRVVEVADRSLAHVVGSQDPWVEGWAWSSFWSGKAPYHPNARGMEAVADMIYEVLLEDGVVESVVE